MDWPSLLIGVALGIVANLLTPSVQRTLAGTAKWSSSRISRLGESGLPLRLKQLHDNYSRILKLKENPPELIAVVMSSVMSVLFVTWVVILVAFGITIFKIGGSNVPPYSYGAIGGILGLGTRWFVGALLVWNDVNDVRNFEKFEKKLFSSRSEIEKLLSRSQQEG